MGDIWDIKGRYEAVMATGGGDAGNRGFWLGSAVPSPAVTYRNPIESVSIASKGNCADFGDLTETVSSNAAVGSTTRAIEAGGFQGPSGSQTDTCSYFTMAHTGNAIDFGNTVSAMEVSAGVNNQVRGVFGGGYIDGSTVASDIIQYVTIATTGNTTDFGNLTEGIRTNAAGASTPTRGWFARGAEYTPSIVGGQAIDLITIASTGNATDFGDLATGRAARGGMGGPSRGFAFGGHTYGPTTATNTMEYWQLTTTGSGTDFGNLTVARRYMGGICNRTRAVAGAGSTPGLSNVMDYIEQSSLGDATDFGDAITTNYSRTAATTGCHGGLQDEDIPPARLNYIPGSGRGMTMGGAEPGHGNTIDYISIPTLGNAVDWGEPSTTNVSGAGACSSVTRGVTAGGNVPGASDVIQYLEFSSQGNMADFGDAINSANKRTGLASPTRGIFSGQSNPFNDVIEYITIASVGDATDFGNLTHGKGYMGGLSSPTIGVFGGAGSATPSYPTYENVIEYITIASTGNGADFGDLTAARGGTGGAASAVRGLFGGGVPASNVIDYITIASAGNATDFGDCTETKVGPSGMSNRTRACFGGGYQPSARIQIDYVTIASTGDAADFGDLSVARGYTAGISDSHGGL